MLVEAWRVSGLSCAACIAGSVICDLSGSIIGAGDWATQSKLWADVSLPTKVESGFIQVVLNDVRPTSDVGIVVGGYPLGLRAERLRAVRV